MRLAAAVLLMNASSLPTCCLLGCGREVYGPPSGPSYPASFTASVASCVAAVGTPATLSIPASNAPALGCQSWESSTQGFLSFQKQAVVPQYALGQETLPANWVGSDLTLTYYATDISGDATWEIEAGCSMGGPSFAYGAPMTVTAVVSSSSGTPVNTGTVANIATVGSNGCAPGATLHYRIYRSNFDSLAGEAYLIGLTMTRRTS
jgi:hypothetical protein